MFAGVCHLSRFHATKHLEFEQDPGGIDGGNYHSSKHLSKVSAQTGSLNSIFADTSTQD